MKINVDLMPISSFCCRVFQSDLDEDCESGAGEVESGNMTRVCNTEGCSDKLGSRHHQPAVEIEHWPTNI